MSVVECTKRVLMVGDHKQLSPPVFTYVHRQKCLADILFQAGYDSCTLNIQYHAHHELYNVTSMTNYHGLVHTHESVFLSKFRISSDQNFYHPPTAKSYISAAVACWIFTFRGTPSKRRIGITLTRSYILKNKNSENLQELERSGRRRRSKEIYPSTVL